MNSFSFSSLLILVFAASLSVEGFHLKCKTGKQPVKYYFVRESQKVSNNLEGIWTCNKYATESYPDFLRGLKFDEHYEKCLLQFFETKYTTSEQFRRDVKKCGAYACKKMEELPEFANEPVGLEEVVRVEVNAFNDFDPTFNDEEEDANLSEVDETSWVITPKPQTKIEAKVEVASTKSDAKQSVPADKTKPVDVEMIGLVLSGIGFVVVVIFMILRAVFPLKNFPFGPRKANVEEPVLKEEEVIPKEKIIEKTTKEEPIFVDLIDHDYLKNQIQVKPDFGYSFSIPPPAYKK